MQSSWLVNIIFKAFVGASGAVALSGLHPSLRRSPKGPHRLSTDRVPPVSHPPTPGSTGAKAAQPNWVSGTSGSAPSDSQLPLPGLAGATADLPLWVIGTTGSALYSYTPRRDDGVTRDGRDPPEMYFFAQQVFEELERGDSSKAEVKPQPVSWVKRIILRVLRPCIFQKKAVEFDLEVFLKVVVAGCGQVGRGLRGGQRKALSTASGPVRASARTVHLSTASRCDAFRGQCAKPDRPLSMQLAG